MMYLKLLIVKGERLEIVRVNSLSYSDKLFQVYYDRVWFLKVIDDFNVYTLKINNVYKIKHPDIFYDIRIYVYENRLTDYLLFEKKDLLFSNYKGHFILDDPLLKNRFLLIKEGQIKSNDNSIIFINGHVYHNEYLKINDVINLLNFEIIVMKDYYLISNNFKTTSSRIVLHPKSVLDYNKYRINRQYIMNINDVKMSYEFKEESYLQERNRLNVISIIQNTFMSCGMLIIGIIQVKNGGYKGLNAGVMLLMPMLMLISALIFPFIQFLNNLYTFRKNKRKYLSENYLKINDLKNSIERDYLTKKQFYSRLSFKGVFNDTMMQRRKSSNDFLYFDFGATKLNTGLIIKSDIKTIELKNKIEELNNLYQFLDGHLILDLKSIKIISIIYSSNKLEHIVESIIAQIAYHHDYNDLKIAIYFKNINYDIKNLKNIKHFLYKDIRLINVNFDILKKIEIPLVIITDEKIELDFANIFYLTNDDSIHHQTKLIYDFKKQLITHQDNRYVFKDFSLKPHFLRELGKYYIDDSHLKYKYYLDNYHAYLNETASRKHLLAFLGIDKTNQPLFFPIDKGIHGLISGTTGSGKSYFIIGMLLHLLSIYRSDELNVCLVDYKGSGIEKALSLGGKKPPQLVLSLNNTDQISLNRSISALKQECFKREKRFEKLSKLSNKSILNLGDYNSLCASYNLKKLPYVLVVVDEFAELKVDRPEFINDLISISRIGRSLGVLLILSTQKASTSIDSEIISNVGYKIVLKVRSKQDSLDLLHSDAAYKLTKPGSFYIDFDDQLSFGQSYNINDDVKGKNGEKVSILDQSLTEKHTYCFRQDNYQSINDYLLTKIDFNDYGTDIFYLDRLKEEDFPIKQAKHKILIGRMDDYLNIKQFILAYDIDRLKLFVVYRYKNTLINFLLNIMTSVIVNHNYYHVILLDDGNLAQEVYIDEVLDYTNDNIIYLNSLINKHKNIMIIISSFKQLYEKIDFKLIELLLKHDCIIGFNEVVDNIKNIILKYFDQRILLDDNSKEICYLLFEKLNDVSEDHIVKYEDRLLGFKLFKPVNLYYQKIKPYVAKLDESVILTDGGFYFGSVYQTRKRLFIKCNSSLIFVAEFETVLNEFKENYPFIHADFLTYDDYKIKIKDYDYVIWLGVGLQGQLLFNTEYKEELKKDEAYIYEVKQKRGYKVKYAEKNELIISK